MIYAYAFITPKFKINTSDNITFYDKNGENIFDNNKDYNYVKLNNISDNVKNAIISVEDKNFYNHKGFDLVHTSMVQWFSLFSSI